MPLEGLWWVENVAAFSLEDKSNWLWTAMILQPEEVTRELVLEAITGATKKKPLPAASQLRLERLNEGQAAQILHVGPIVDEPPTIERLHFFIAAEGYQITGKHHEIYLNDPRRTDPAKLRIVIRYPIETAA